MVGDAASYREPWREEDGGGTGNSLAIDGLRATVRLLVCCHTVRRRLRLADGGVREARAPQPASASRKATAAATLRGRIRGVFREVIAMGMACCARPLRKRGWKACASGVIWGRTSITTLSYNRSSMLTSFICF